MILSLVHVCILLAYYCKLRVDACSNYSFSTDILQPIAYFTYAMIKASTVPDIKATFLSHISAAFSVFLTEKLLSITHRTYAMQYVMNSRKQCQNVLS